MSILPTTAFTSSSTFNHDYGMDFSLVQPSMYVHVSTPAEMCAHRSNECADLAVAWAAKGRFITAEACAELADLYALLGSVLGNADLLAYAIPKTMGPLMAEAIQPASPPDKAQLKDSQ